MAEGLEVDNNLIAPIFRGHIDSLYSAIINNSNDAIISKSLDGMIQSWNKGAEKIFGFTAAEAIGKHISILIPDDRINEESIIIDKIKAKQTVEHYETLRRNKLGQLINISVSVSPIIDAQGMVVGASKVARDITAKKVTEEALLDINDRLKLQTEEILEVMLNYVIKDFSLQATISDRGDELDAIAVGLNTLGEELEEALDSSKRYVEQLKELNTGLEKIVEERTTELAQYKYALDAAGAVEITDTKGIVIYGNDNKSKLSKYTKEEFIGKDAGLVNSGYHTKAFIKEMWDTISSGNVWRGEFKNKAKDGTYFWVATTIIPFLDAGGKPYQYMAIKNDITESKNYELERIEKAKELESVNKELESFSYSVSHDLRAPLRAVDGYALMLEEDYDKALDSEGKRLLSVIRQNARYMGNLIDDLLNFSRLGRKEVKKANVNMMELTQTIVNDVLQENTKANISIHPLHSVNADQLLIGNVMVNLLSNAVKYSSKVNKPVVEISSEDKGDEIVFSIKDNGAGFEMEYADKLFGVFQRLHTADEFEGTGVGLATAQRIIQKHGGHIWAEGAVGKGATFYFSLPVEK